MIKPKFYGVSVGPGEPELMTIKAVKVIEKCDVIAAPRTHRGNTLALDIVKQVVNLEGKEIIYTDFAMSRDENENRENHEITARDIERVLNEGKNVAMLSIGDISVFSTFSYILDMLRDKFECEIVAGVTSFSACAAKAKTSLTDMKKPLTIVPGSFSDIDSILKLEGTKVIMKSGKKLEDVIDSLDKNKSEYVIVQNCGLENENIVFNGNGDIDSSYFTTILVKE